MDARRLFPAVVQLGELEPSLQCQWSWPVGPGAETVNSAGLAVEQGASRRGGRDRGRLQILPVLLGPQQSPIVNH